MLTKTNELNKQCMLSWQLIRQIIFAVIMMFIQIIKTKYFQDINKMDQERRDQERRELPRRTSRGVRHQQTEEEKKEDDQIYDQLFGDLNDSGQSDEPFSQQLGLRPLETFTANFANYNYSRGYHYFFNLDTFPRVQGSKSYASDQINRFNFTYSQDQQMVNGSKLKQILNRKYVGLPCLEDSKQYTKSQDKNVCHYHLFNIQDKKYYNHRLILKYKCVLKNLEKLHEKNKLRFFTELKKDIVMHEVCQKNTSMDRRREILQSRIKVLEERVKNMSPNWNWEDDIYYHFSLDQEFHNAAMAKGHKLSQKNLKEYIKKRIAYRKMCIQGTQFGNLVEGVQKIKHSIESWLIFQEQQNNGLSVVMQNRLKSMPKIKQMFQRREELVIFPLFTFNFGSKDIEKVIDPLIKAKLQKQHESCFYVYKAFVKRLLRRQYASQEQHVVEPINIEEYTNQMKKKLVKIENYYKKQIVAHKKVLYVDDIIQMEKLQNSSIGEQVHLLQPGHRIQITRKQLMLLFFYRNITIALQQFIEYLNQDPEILKFMADPNYDQFHYGIARVIRQPEFCILINDLARFAEILSATNTPHEFDGKLYFSFNEKLRIAYAWKELENDEWETQRDEDEDEAVQNHDQDDQLSMRDVFQSGDPKPSKKHKAE